MLFLQVVIGHSRHQLGNVIIGEAEKIDNGKNTKLSPIWWIVFVIIPVCLLLIAFVCFKKWKKKSLRFFDEVNLDNMTGHVNGKILINGE